MTFAVNMLGMEQLATLGTRMDVIYRKNLMLTVPHAVDNIVAYAVGELQPGHGYDTGLLHDTLTKVLVEDLMAEGVFYSVLSEEAGYWEYMEFGFTMQDGNFWPGYHFIEQAISVHHRDILQAAALAWTATEMELAAETAAVGMLANL